MQTIGNRSIAALGAVLATFATVAAASPARAETSTATVSYAGLDLSSPAGSAILERRLRTAAARVCGTMELPYRTRTIACRQTAIANAKASLRGAVRPVMVAVR